jgi:glycosyltransferase involved in cell wall biosynthesis
MISFVMPCFNAQVYLSEAIQSIIDQKYKNIELIIVNDASTDSSLEIAEWHRKKDKRIRIITLDKNGGMSNARNIGNNEARGSIIAVQDADDLSLPTRAGTIARFFEKNPKVDMFYSAFFMINEYGAMIEGFAADPFSIERVYEFRVANIGHPTLAYKKSVILKHPYQDGQWSRLGCEDFRLITELWKTGHKFGLINKPLVLYRWHSQNSTQTRNKDLVNAIKNEYIENYLKKEADNETAENVVCAD